MADQGKGRVYDTHGTTWEIREDGATVARYLHARFPDFVHETPVFFSLPLDSSGMTTNVWLQAAVRDLIKIAMPEAGATPRAVELIEKRVNRHFFKFGPMQSDKSKAGMDRLVKSLEVISKKAAASKSGRLDARSL